jgi:BirA family biotin operon repressor/biotin-[acetyl-CoA-carboxylase] ligase
MSVSVVPAALAAALGVGADRLRPFGVRVVHLATTTSTNDHAARLASGGAPEGTLVVANAQTAGRGRLGHTWFSPPGAGLYVSAVLRPADHGPDSARRTIPLLTLMAGVALAGGLRAASGVRARIKWPNDIVVERGRAHGAHGCIWPKVAGILAEGSATGVELQHVILGYGVNVSRVEYPAEIAGRATSLEDEAGREVDRMTVLVETLAALSHEYAALAAGDARDLLSRWRALSPSCEGAAVSWTRGGEQREGVTAGLDGDGALLVRTRPGAIEAVRAGEVTWL